MQQRRTITYQASKFWPEFLKTVETSKSKLYTLSQQSTFIFLLPQHLSCLLTTSLFILPDEKIIEAVLDPTPEDSGTPDNNIKFVVVNKIVRIRFQDNLLFGI